MFNKFDNNPLHLIIEPYSWLFWDNLGIVSKELWHGSFDTKPFCNVPSERQKRDESTTVNSDDTVTSIDVKEQQKAESVILKNIQSKCFKNERESLHEADKNASAKNAKMLKRSSKIFKLDQVLNHGLVCVGGCLGKAPIDQQAKHPQLCYQRVITL